MSTNPANQTLPGGYGMGTAPDGSPVAMSKLANGEWVMTKDRISDTERFSPQTDRAVGGPNVELDPEKLRASHDGSRNRLKAYIIEILGEPACITRGDPLAVEALKKCYANFGTYRHVVGLIEALNSPEWNEAKSHFARLLGNIATR